MKNKEKIIFLTLHILVGILIGYLFLHPASILIFHLFEKNTFSLELIIHEAFSPIHTAMALYFSGIGAVLGVLSGIYGLKIKQNYQDLFSLNSQLSEQNIQIKNHLYSMLYKSPERDIILQRIIPTVKKIEEGVNMISNQSAGGLNKRQALLISITKENISQLFSVVESIILDNEKT